LHAAQETLPQLSTHITQIPIGIQMIGINRQGPVKLGHGDADLALMLAARIGTRKRLRPAQVNNAQVVVRVGVVRIHQNRTLQINFGVVEVPGQIVKGVKAGAPDLGIIKGLWYWFSREIDGVYDVVTCLVPNPEDTKALPFDEKWPWSALGDSVK